MNIPKPNVCLLHHPGVQPTAGASHTKRKQDRTVTTLGTQESKGERERERHRSGNDNTQPSRLEIESKRHISCARTLCLFFSLEDHAADCRMLFTQKGGGSLCRYRNNKKPTSHGEGGQEQLEIEKHQRQRTFFPVFLSPHPSNGLQYCCSSSAS